MRRFVPDFEYYLCDLSRYADDEIVGSNELQTGFLLMKYIFRREFEQWWGEIVGKLNVLSEEQVKENLKPIVRYVSEAAPGLTPRQMEEKLKEAFPKKVGGVMQTVAEIWMKQGVKQGIEQGLKQGL